MMTIPLAVVIGGGPFGEPFFFAFRWAPMLIWLLECVLILVV